MAEIDDELILEVCKLRAIEFDKFSATENANRYRNITNRGRLDAEQDPIDHYEWRAKLQKIIRLTERKLRGTTHH